MILTQFEEMYGNQKITLVVMPYPVRIGDQVELPDGSVFTVKTVTWIVHASDAKLTKLHVRMR